MKLSVLLPLDRSPDETIATAQAAEAGGLAGIWVPDHLAGGAFFTSGHWRGSISALAQIESATSTIHLGTLVASAVLRPPEVLALEMASLGDRGRRVRAAVGRGAESDAAVTGIDLPDTAALRDYASRVIHQLGAGAVIVAANVTSSVRVAAELGSGWVTTGGLRRFGDAKLERVRQLHREYRSLGGRGPVLVLIDPHEQSPWRSSEALSRALATWGGEGIDELVVWPPDVYVEDAAVSWADAGAIASSLADGVSSPVPPPDPDMQRPRSA